MMMADMLPGQRATVQEMHRDALAEALETEDYQLLEIVPLLWCGWECDTHAALALMPDGRSRLAVLDSVRTPGEGGTRAMFEARLRAYAAAASDLRRFLDAADRAGAE